MVKDNNINFTVEKQPLYLKSGSIVEDQFANVRRDTGDVVGVVGKNYKVVDHLRTISMFTEAIHNLSGGKFVMENVVQNGGKKVFTAARITSPGFGMTVGKGEDTQPSITMINSYDGSISLGFDISIVRMICSNGMVFQSKIAELVRRKHFPLLQPDRIIDGIPDAIRAYQEDYKNFYATTHGKKTIEVTPLEDDKRFPKKLIEAARQLPEFNTDLWGQYNAFTNVLTRWDVTEDNRRLLYQINAQFFAQAIAA
jgi:hypothetical protein